MHNKMIKARKSKIRRIESKMRRRRATEAGLNRNHIQTKASDLVVPKLLCVVRRSGAAAVDGVREAFRSFPRLRRKPRRISAPTASGRSHS